ATAATGSFFEHCVCRVAGLPVETLEALRATESVRLADALAVAEDELAGLATPLSELLYATIGDTAERKLRGKLLGLRRDVHNLRPVSVARVRRLEERLDGDVAAALAAYAATSARRDALANALPAAYERDLARVRRGFQRAVADDDFQRGLLLSSRVLVAELARYRSTPVEALGAKERQIERGLLRYLSRMAMKTSPYGTFTAVVPGRFIDDGAAAGEGRPRFAGDPRTKRSLVRLNKRIYPHLRDELLADAEARRWLPVELNPTLHQDGGDDNAARWRFLAEEAGREVFQRLPAHPVLDLFRRLLAAGPRPLGELLEVVAHLPEIDADEAAVAAYTERLLAVGFLRFRLGVAPQDAEWDRPLSAVLDGVPGETAARVRRLVAELRRRRDDFVAAAGTDCEAALDAAVGAMRETFPALLERTGLPSDVPFYEDAGADARLLLPRRELAAAEESLAHLARATARLGWPRHDTMLARAFFDHFYGSGVGSVPLLRFYEDYHREYFKGRLERQRAAAEALAAAAGEAAGQAAGDAVGEAGEEAAGGDAAPEGDGPEFAAEAEEVRHLGFLARRRLVSLIAERWRGRPDALAIGFSRQDLDRAVAPVPAMAADDYSTSVFVQVLPGEADDGGPALLASSLLGGFGKYFSRFLSLFPDEVQADLMRRNEQSPVLLAEIGADGDFNANLHPPLVPWEIGYPTAEPGAAERRLSVADLAVERDPGDRRALCLRRSGSGERVVPLDLGFMNPHLRPPLFQLLTWLAPAANFGLQMPESPDEGLEPPVPGADDDAGEPRVAYRPRIVFDGRLVVARRRWKVPSELFPRREAAESDAAYFLRADRWRRSHGVPCEVFVSLRPIVGVPQPKTDEIEKRELRAHVHKPQYVDFANPLLVDLFGRLVEEDDPRRTSILLHERLPARRHLAAADGEAGRAEHHVTELVVQVDLPGGLEAGDGAAAAAQRSGDAG
ncbi:MAG TPA: lantibiotic dehydratase, partial [Thermoanaerobaculia bacterium]|nr:lantibiotic dehydratase [Thermoanaerobaculia bacterium]